MYSESLISIISHKYMSIVFQTEKITLTPFIKDTNKSSPKKYNANVVKLFQATKTFAQKKYFGPKNMSPKKNTSPKKI